MRIFFPTKNNSVLDNVVGIYLIRYFEQLAPDLLVSFFVDLFDFLFNVHREQLRSCRDRQLSLSHLSWAG